MKISINDSRFYSIYGVAKKFDKPVFVHTGKRGSPDFLTSRESTHPDFLEEAIQLYPEVQFIIGHMGNRADFEGLDDPQDDFFRLALHYPSVWLEASTIGSPSNDPDGEKLFSVYSQSTEMPRHMV